MKFSTLVCIISVHRGICKVHDGRHFQKIVLRNISKSKFSNFRLILTWTVKSGNIQVKRQNYVFLTMLSNHLPDLNKQSYLLECNQSVARFFHQKLAKKLYLYLLNGLHI